MEQAGRKKLSASAICIYYWEGIDTMTIIVSFLSCFTPQELEKAMDENYGKIVDEKAHILKVKMELGDQLE